MVILKKNRTRRSAFGMGTILPISYLINSSSADQAPTFSLSIGTYGLPRYTLADAIKLVTSTGYDSIELASMPGYHGAPDAISKSNRREINKLLTDSNLKLGALMGLPTPTPKKQTENTDWVKKLLELATDLSPANPPIIQSVLGGGLWSEKKDLFRDSLGPWVELATNANVQLAIKPHRGHAMSLPTEGIWLIEQLKAKTKLGLVYDHSHFAFRNLSTTELVTQALPYTRYIVVKDAFLVDEKVRFALPGTTPNLPHSDILKQFAEGGYRGEICAEVSSQVWKAKDYDPIKATKTCYSKLKKIVSQVEA